MQDTNEVPLVKGGQGRTAESLKASAAWIAILVVYLLAGFGLGSLLS